MDFEVKMNRKLLEEIIDSLGSMINYADDGGLDRRDESFSYFFKEVDNARDLLERLNKMFGEEYAKSKMEGNR